MKFSRIRIVKVTILSSFFFVLTSVAQPSYADSDSSFWSPSMIAGGFAASGVIGALFAYLVHPSGDKTTSADCTDCDITAALTADDVIFTMPGITNLVINNPNNQEVMVDSLSLSGLAGVSIGDISACQPVPANGACNVPLTATIDAYGSGKTNIKYDDNKNTTSNVTVSTTNVELYKCASRNQQKTKCKTWETTSVPTTQEIILEKETSPQFLRYTNAGNFAWQKKDATYIGWKQEFDSGVDVVLAEDAVDPSSKCGGPNIDPTESCIFTLTNSDGKDHPGKSGILKITGGNIGGEVNKNVVASGGLEIVMNLSNDDLHLSYRSLKVINTVKGKNVTLDADVGVTVTSGGGKVEYCDPSSPPTPACTYQSTCTINQVLGQTPSNNFCLIWLRAKDINKLGIDNAVEISVEAKGTPDSSPSIQETDTFKITHEQSLYTGGKFTTAGGNSANRIAKWNGTSWLPLDIGINDQANALALMDGDLYAGGAFTTTGALPANHIARWNGSAWSPLISGGQNGVNGDVITLTTINGDLYTGGDFTTVGVLPANYIASWDGSAWSALGSGMTGANPRVRAIAATLNNNIYAGGLFTIAGGSTANNIAGWISSAWSSLTSGAQNGVDGNVRALLADSNDLYAGGKFTTAGGLTVNNIAMWDGSTWSQLIDNSIIGVDGIVRTLTGNGQELYAGGDFTTAGTLTVNNIAMWDGTGWNKLTSGSQTGVDARVNTLTTNANDQELYAGGSFTTAGGLTVNHVAMWDENSNKWQQLGSGTDGDVHSLIISPSLVITEHTSSSP